MRGVSSWEFTRLPVRRPCTNFTGGAAHERQDAATFALWGVDYLKYDICSYRQVLQLEARGDPIKARQMMEDVYRRMYLALLATHRPIVYSISQHGLSQVWKWEDAVGANLWRTGDDVHDDYLSITDIGFAQAGLAPFARPAHWNDPDMLEIGNGAMTVDEQRTQISLWSLLAAPLLAGNDLAKMDPATLSILTNREVIRIDQDPLGKQGDRVWSQGPLEIWAREASDGSKAVGLFNRNAGAAYITLKAKTLGWRAGGAVHDVWANRNLPALGNERTYLVPRHGVVLLVLRPT